MIYTHSYVTDRSARNEESGFLARSREGYSLASDLLEKQKISGLFLCKNIYKSSCYELALIARAFRVDLESERVGCAIESRLGSLFFLQDSGILTV